MRQAKFRGYSLETNSWHYGNGWFAYDYTEDYRKQRGIEDKACLYTESSPIECELKSIGSYTGLKDKNGKEIFEGDILQYTYTENSCWGPVGTYTGHVIFEEGTFEVTHHAIINGLLENNDELKRLVAWADNVKVIGNIYENPNLIPRTHYLKIESEYFVAVKDGRKTFEIRKNDRSFSENDNLILQEFGKDTYTGREVQVRITYITDFAQQDGYVVLGIKLKEDVLT